MTLSYGVEFPITFTAGSSTGAFNVQNNGTLIAYPILTLTGQLTNPVLSNRTTREFFELDYTIPEGVTVTADFKQRTVSIVGGQNIGGNVLDGSTWFPFIVGENQMRLLTDNSSDTGQLSVVWTNSFSGV